MTEPTRAPDEPSAPGPSEENLASSIEATVVDLWHLGLNFLRTFAVLTGRPWTAGNVILNDAAAGRSRYVSPIFLLTIAATLQGVFLVSWGAGGDAITDSVNTVREAIEGNPARALPAILGTSLAILGTAWVGARALVREGPYRDGMFQVLLYALSVSFIGGVAAEAIPRPYNFVFAAAFAVTWPGLILVGFLRTVPDRRGVFSLVAAFIWPLVATAVAFPMGEAAHIGAELAVPALTLDIASLGPIEVEDSKASVTVLLRNKTERPLYVHRETMEILLPGGVTMRPVRDAEAEPWINVDDEDDESLVFEGVVTPEFTEACDQSDFKGLARFDVGGFEPARTLHLRLRGATCKPFERGLIPSHLPRPLPIKR